MKSIREVSHVRAPAIFMSINCSQSNIREIFALTHIYLLYSAVHVTLSPRPAIVPRAVFALRVVRLPNRPRIHLLLTRYSPKQASKGLTGPLGCGILVLQRRHARVSLFHVPWPDHPARGAALSQSGPQLHRDLLCDLTVSTSTRVC